MERTTDAITGRTRRRPVRRREGGSDWAIAAVIAAGGALGALSRYGLSLALPHAQGSFPWSTLIINVTGSLAIGVLMVLLTEVAGRPHRMVRPFVGVGLLGGYTTFSTYTVETQQLLLAGAPATALAYLAGTVIAALVAVEIGMVLTRALTRRSRREVVRHLGRSEDDE